MVATADLVEDEMPLKVILSFLNFYLLAKSTPDDKKLKLLEKAIERCPFYSEGEEGEEMNKAQLKKMI